MCLARDEQIRLRLAKSKPALLRLLRYPHANSAAGIFVLKDNPRLLKRGLDAHQGRKLEPLTVAPILAVLAADVCTAAPRRRRRSRR